ncbi:type I Iterative Polyketide synthase (PKS) [Aspergillus brasiliensis]|uniref:Type I Iterative Polyketide synthase (PKS) n=1 Tax=Aspergillus brasiliensis TaxID=319629 RepID=A0A9W5YWL4_9EURO|nr:type I Iterative Polyketide synthase (PKS) [Aspergillus brasiliensis]
MACRLPGGVRSPDELYEFLLEKKDGVCEVPSTRYTIDSFYSDTKSGAAKTRHGYFLQEDPMWFDARFFSLSDPEAKRMDPQQRKLMEVVWECLESAGETGWQGQDIGCYVAVYGEDWLDLASKDPQATDRYHVLGTGQFALSNRISYEYDFRGPSMTLQSACSGSMLALHEACQSIYSGDACGAIVAGTSLILAPTMTVTMSENGVLSPDGTCKTFDAKADGYGRAEAVNALYVKSLQDAIRDGNPIRAVIRATTTNSDGKTASITSPSEESQVSLVKRAYKKAGIDDITQTGFFECHGTGTVAGDTVEASAVAKLFKGKGVVIGSVKPNLGHGEGASAITSIIKAVVSLENKMIIPNVFFDTPNPNIPFKDGMLQVPLDPMPWPEGRSHRVSVNSFGIGGANGHVILDSSAGLYGKDVVSPRESLDENSRLLVVSARSAESLRERIEQVVGYAEKNPSLFHDLVYTLGSRREHLSHRAFTVTQMNQSMSSSSFQIAVNTAPELVWVFTGQGAQWAGMGQGLMQAFPIARDCIMQLTTTLQQLPDRPSWSLHDELCKEGGDSRVNKAEFSQPLCTALQIALVDVLRSWGIQPSCVVGHSSGEIAAAYAAGAITARAAIIIAYYRGLVAKQQEGMGAMAAVGISSEEVQPYLQAGVVVACHNSPSSITLSGDPPALNSVIDRIKSRLPDVLCRRLKVSIAYHSHHMHELGDDYEASISPYIDPTGNMLPLYSSVRAEPIREPSELNARYWRSNLQSPVLFGDAVRDILAASPVARAFLEIGPHSALSAPLRQIFQSQGSKVKQVYVSTLIRNAVDARHQLLTTAGSLHANGVSVNLEAINGQGVTLGNLPPYPWQHTTRYLHESRLTRKWRFREYPHHELLGDRVVESSDLEPSWRNILRLADVPWIGDHVLQGNILLPATGYIAMIGAAIGQLHPSQEDYSIRNLVLKTPLLLKESDELETLTTLKRERISDIADSEWYTFSIMSYDEREDRWIKHCSGAARAGVEHTPKFSEVTPYTRLMDVDQCYRMFEQLGLMYGPAFKGLRRVTFHSTEVRASGTVADMGEKPSQYTLHPATMDSILQPTLILSTRMQTISGGAVIPSAFDQIYVGGSAPQISFDCETYRPNTGLALADIRGTAGDRTVFSVSGLIGFPISLTQGFENPQPLCSQIRWIPDVEMIAPDALLRSDQGSRQDQLWQDANRLCELSILEASDRFREITAVEDHLIKWQRWVTTQANRLRQRDDAVQPESEAGNSNQSRQETMSQITLKYVNAGDDDYRSIVFECISQITDHCSRIALGEVSALDVLEVEGRLERYNKWMQSQCDWSHFLSLWGHSHPTTRVLEIGSGTGSATEVVLRSLQSSDGVRQYSQYTITEGSEEFLHALQQKFQKQEAIEYALLDISTDPEAQGFDLQSYDLIIASNLHTIPRLASALEHIRKLLAPQGRLLLHELYPEPSLMTEYLMGSLIQWSSVEDFRPNSKPYLSPEEWDIELRNAGFIGNEAMAYDVPPPHQTYFTVLTHVLDPRAQAETHHTVTILTTDSTDTPGPWENEVASRFRQEGCLVNWTTLRGTPPTDGWIISLLDLDGPYLDDIPEDRYLALKSFLMAADQSHIIWVTNTSQMACVDPRFGLIHGLTRALRHEAAVGISLFETDCYTQEAAGALFQVVDKLQRERQYADLATGESEFSFFQGTIHVGRCHWMSSACISPAPQTPSPRRLDMETLGLIDTIKWVATDDSPEELAAGHVEVDVHYVGLNFRDVLVGMGVFGSVDELGLEGSGLVRRVASDVQDLQPGDRVLVLASGAFGTRGVVDATYCFKVPAGAPLQDAAALGTVYMTAIHCLCHLARVRKGDVYATVGNEEKVAYLVNEFGIPRNHIFGSRNSDFLPNLMAETQGRGVDIVLNSLVGKLLHTSWECVAPFGRFVEIGKRDFLGHGQLAMAPFIQNRSYFGFDLFQLAKEKSPEYYLAKQSFEDWYARGYIKPIRPATIYDAAKVTDAFRYMQQGTHMGKILIRMPLDPMELAPTSLPPVRFSPNKSYLLVGGLGGVGRSVSLWMVQRGARHLVVLSRSAGTSDADRAVIMDLQAQGCHVICVTGSVAVAADVESAIARCPRPLAGVLQMSALLKDKTFPNLTYDDWTSCLATKVQGTWNLHHATLTRAPLDWFILFSSIVGVCGNSGQANYAAANTFLDSFTRYRRHLGLPSATIALGAVKDGGGLVSRDPKVLQMMQAASVRLLTEEELLEGLELAIRQCNSQSPSPSSSQGATTSDTCIIGLGNTRPTSDPTVRTAWPPSDARFALYANVEVKEVQTVTATGSVIRELMRKVEQNPALLEDPDTERSLARELNQQLAQQVSQTADMSEEDVAELPVDSLMAVEIQRQFRRDFDWEVSMVEISKIGKVGKLSEAAIHHIKKRHGLVKNAEE